MSHRDHALASNSCRYCREAVRRAITRWSNSNRRNLPWRRNGRSSYALVLAEVLLQQTRAENVAAVFEAITSRCPDWPELAAISVPELQDLLRPLGLHRRRATTLHELAMAVLDRGALPIGAAELQKLPGLGQYMARAIAAQLHGERVAPVDVNVARVLERVFGPRELVDIRYDPYLQQLAESMMPARDPGGYLMALLDFAASVCSARSPHCRECPVRRCRYAAEIGTR